MHQSESLGRSYSNEKKKKVNMTCALRQPICTNIGILLPAAARFMPA